MKKPSLTTKESWNELVLSDLHLTEAKDDEYKWEVFPWTIKQLKKYNIKKLLILGDSLDKKDRHPSKLVNRLVSELVKISKEDIDIKILMGNHDYIAEGSPFLNFISEIEGITYITVPTIDGNDLWLPHTKTPTEDWGEFDFSSFKRVFIHQSIIGAKTSQFYNIEHGLSTTYFKGKDTLVLAGDIHVPQEVNGVFYIGSPYPVHFGDDFEGCAVLLNGTTKKRLFRKGIKKCSVRITSIEDLKMLDLNSGDRIKIEMTLPEEDIHSWAAHKKEIEKFCKVNSIMLKAVGLKKAESKEIGAEEPTHIHKKTHEETFLSYCDAQEVSDISRTVGLRILHQVEASQNL